MNTAEFIGVSIYVVGAFFLALAMVFAMGLALQTEHRYGQFLLPSTFPVIGLGIAASTLLSGRNLGSAALDPTAVSNGLMGSIEGLGQGNATWPLRFATLYILAACFALVLAYLFRGGSNRAHGRGLMVAFAIYFFANVVAPAALGSKPAFVLNHYYPLIVFLAVFATRMHDGNTVLRSGMVTLLFLLVGSIATALILPSLVLQQPYVDGWIPGLRIRLWGLASHANSIGPIALLYVLLALHLPFKSRWLQGFGLLVAAVVLVLAQSKTAWVSLFLLVGTLAYYQVMSGLKSAWNNGRTSVQAIVSILVAILLALGILIALVTVDLGIYWDRFARSSSGSQLFSLTGRSEVWDVAIRVWRQNPLFGYGPTLWDYDFRRSIGMSFAFSAHNQFLQSLASAGAVGLAGVSLYILTILRYSLLLGTATRGLSVVLGLFLLLRCMTETPLTTNTLFNGDLLSHLIIVSVLLRYNTKERVERLRDTVTSLPASRATMAT